VQGSASGAGAPIEVEVRDSFGFGRIVCGRLVEVEAGIGVEGEIVLRRSAGGGEGRRGSGQAEVGEDGVDGFSGSAEGEDAHVGAAVGAGEGEELVDAGEEASPAGAGGGALRGVRQVGGGGVQGGASIVRLTACQAADVGGVVAAEVDHLLTQARGRGKDTVVAVAMDAWRRDQTAECGEKFEGREGEEYVGEQDWRHIAGGATGPGLTPPGEAPRCTPANLTAERGAADAADVARVLSAEGFPPGTVVYLNVERVERVTPELTAYVAAWVGGLLDGGRYVPALYAHASNAPNLLALATGEFAQRGRRDRPRLSVARTGSFALELHPRESGITQANVWQGVLDTSETWGGSTLRIDRNVADSPSPSAPAGAGGGGGV
jgi:hypothetical protein